MPPTVAIWTNLQNFYLVGGAGATIVVFGFLIYTIAKNRERPGKKAPAFAQPKSEWGNWKVILVLVALAGGLDALVEYETFASASLVAIPNAPDALHIGVTGHQWVWQYTYPDGYSSFSNMTVPEGQIVILNITSADVTHGFFIPTLDVGKDAQPGIVNQIWFNATQTGVFTIECRQLCGVGHALMISKLVVDTPQQYQAWYAKLPAAPAAKGGA